MSSLRPDLFLYLDYRSWLKDMVEYIRIEKRKSTRRLCLEADFGSPSFLGMIIQGKRHLGSQSIKKIEKVLELSSAEVTFLTKLIAFAVAKDLDEKDRCYRALITQLKKNKVRLVQASEYEFFSSWHHVAVLESLLTNWTNKTTKTQAALIGISIEELQESFQLLARLGLIKREEGKWTRTSEQLATSSETQSDLIRQFHRQMLDRSIQSLQRDDPQDRFNSALTISINSKNYERLKKRLEELQKEIHLEYSDSKDPNQVVQFNLQFFSVLQPLDISAKEEG